MKHLVLASVLLVSLAACALPGSQQSSAANDHHCADKVAQATTTTAPVVGLWDCLTPAFQTTIKEVGLGSNPDDALSIGVATSTVLLGATNGFVTYEVILNQGEALQTHHASVVLAVWLVNGKVDNVGVANPAF